MTRDENFKVDDVVTWTHWTPGGGNRSMRGKVTKRSPSRITAQAEDGTVKVFNRRSQGFDCRKVDVAREQWHRDLAVWWEARPATRALAAIHGIDVSGGRLEIADGCTLLTIEEVDGLIAEAYAIREWLLRRPQEPTS